ncbi:crotonase/enoyl-CoA hydratase family protein [Xanthomonas hortorum pv. pelargonii]|uniref:crotonase/enoyl-CoA hydratase family protein n=1 Tax=Xanthomonas hortorum TaxID=56454 RepID=UPI0021C7279C|nr:crotonase/enoyl-CoA hydratase family protein [Xanthomonas hortorum]MCU1702859.1 crotonase/enoyl-CoA hydratase family protein [Xanthomonas hortorum pv. pelargonii]MCU1711963.1 crotonase/enoyl-CoA hydratase family protein [Xanthomonas hortorum pv. pelargonii]
MSAVQPFVRTTIGSTLRVIEELQRDVYWIHMHADLDINPGRACFSSRLVDDITRYQVDLGQRLLHAGATSPHVVLASDSDVFNLGGDLALFCQLIREGDRARLLDYAQRCVRGVNAFHVGLGARAHSIALVQGNALGGGFEAALSCHTIIAEEGVMMGLPEVLFDLFPGMGAYSFMCQRVSPQLAQRIMLNGNLYSAEELLAMGLIDRVVPRGQGVAAVEQVIRESKRTPHAWAAMQQVRGMTTAVPLEEMMRITEIWVDTAMQLGEKSLRTMDRLVRAQSRRSGLDAG